VNEGSLVERNCINWWGISMLAAEMDALPAVFEACLSIRCRPKRELEIVLVLERNVMERGYAPRFSLFPTRD
jgi:hypothetical protein